MTNDSVRSVDDKIKLVGVVGIKQAGDLWRDSETARTLLRPWRTVVAKFWRRRKFTARSAQLPATRRAVQGLRQRANAPVKLVIHPPKLAVALQLVGRYSKSHQHGYKNKSVPKLQ